MIPWPIVLLCGLYMAIATSSAASAWRGLQHAGLAAAAWPAVWLAACGTAVAGLAFMKPWSRTWSVWLSIALLVSTLAGAVWAVTQTPPQPARSFAATGLAGVYVVVIRYVTRPRVKGWFATPTA